MWIKMLRVKKRKGEGRRHDNRALIRTKNGCHGYGGAGKALSMLLLYHTELVMYSKLNQKQNKSSLKYIYSYKMCFSVRA